ncbi:Na+-dependent transporter, SNF family [Thermodesulfovibrio aggregans]|uniref:Na+-dependent transporter, SNF family n=1 Tax=Thermodesulfovibrio aggregans TaxID=86166 RepID=A0A0U9HU31_9BACT|nr:sodium-dependent transporter [Thermodesulfovibrio aggregans]GAQ94077.1 Na+-dependent transporter, SNF family [Thermodesulfovibrio aggregans]
MSERASWGSKLGLILATAGNAVGLGNILRFPSKAALYGGGAFMVPYFIALLLMGFPLMIIEWVIGRYAGKHGHGSMTGILGLFFNHASWARILGSIGVAIPLLICMYYIYIESWTMGFAFLSLFSQMPKPVITADAHEAVKPYVSFFKEYTKPSILAYFFLVLTIAINWFILQKGVRRGIEIIAKIGMPTIILLGIFLGLICISANNWKGFEGLKFIYNLNFSKITDPVVWVEASGQIFFTLSLGMGAIAVYASYVRPQEDVVKAGVYTVSINEFIEIIIGASIAIPAAFAMFSGIAIPELAKEGTFRLGFMTMPAVLMNLPFGWFVSFVWFMLLFLAALTSSLALIQPLIALFEDEMKWEHTKAVTVSMILVTIGAHLSAFIPNFIDELDFWAGCFMLLLFGLVEIVVFVWIFGINNFYKELTQNTTLRLPKIVVWITAIIPPIFIFLILYFWVIKDFNSIISMVDSSKLIARLFILLFLIFLAFIAVKSRSIVMRDIRYMRLMKK